jgi:hypothetical protein
VAEMATSLFKIVIISSAKIYSKFAVRCVQEHFKSRFLVYLVHGYQRWALGHSANKFRKSQIRKFADLNNLLDLPTFRKCDTLRSQSFL